MNDIVLWQKLRDLPPGLTTAQWTEWLTPLAEAPFKQRIAFMVSLAQLSRHTDPAVRALAIKSLDACAGLPARELLVSALNDDCSSVVSSAVHALAGLPPEYSDQIIHALFHPRLDVRLMAVEHLPFQRSEWLIPMLKDSGTKDSALRRLLEPTMTLHSVRAEAVFVLHDEGDITDDRARGLLVKMHAGRILERLSIDWESLRERADVILEGAQKGTLTQPPDFPSNPPQRLNQLLHILWPADARLMTRKEENFFHELVRVIRADNFVKRIVFTAALYETACTRDAWPLWAVRALLWLSPRLFLNAAIPADVRKSACMIWAEEHKALKYPPQILGQLLRSDACRTEGGRFDLRVLGAMLGLLDNSPYVALSKALPKDEILEAARHSPHDLPFFFQWTDNRPGGRNDLLPFILKGVKVDSYRLIAEILCHTPMEDIGDMNLLDSFSTDEQWFITEALLDLTCGEDAPHRMSPKKTRRLAKALGRLLNSAHIVCLIEWAMRQDEGHKHLFARDVFEELSRKGGAENEDGAWRVIIMRRWSPSDFRSKTPIVQRSCTVTPWRSLPARARRC